ncbi:sperm motility kinase 2B-like [Dipodomys spectabilis]|uniref:sperm motility kinase 2B-like n=1 Tax=Dipodomys spectabilis TaxID=105255 RepID=UPI001C534F52|nr:sperm motility kinase 2B-like [Dipodomys spectabilis]
MASKRREAKSWQSLEAISVKNELFKAHYQLLRTIREGGCAPVKLARHLPTDSLVAVKVLDKRDSSFFANELDILKTVDHPNIIRLFEVVESEERIYLVMEYLDGGDLADHLKKVQRMREEEARQVFRQVLRAIKYCHDNGISHRDIKPDNIIFDSKGTAKLGDFGFSVRFQPGQELEGEYGTMAYWAPEMFKQQHHQGPKVDVWCLGVVLYYMVMGNVPFTGRSWVVLRKQVLGGRFELRKSFSPELCGMLAYLLTEDPKKRPLVKQIMRHPWLRPMGSTSPSLKERTPNKPDPTILYVMAIYLGFDPADVQAALSGRKFNAAMGTYRILQGQQDKGRNLTRLMKRLLPLRPPCPSPAFPGALPLHIKRASAPARHRRPVPVDQLDEEEDGRRKSSASICLPCLLCSPCMTGTEWVTEGRKSFPPAAAAAGATPTLPTGPTPETPAVSRADSLPHILYNTWTRAKQREKREDISSATLSPEAADAKAPEDVEEVIQLPSEAPPAETTIEKNLCTEAKTEAQTEAKTEAKTEVSDSPPPAPAVNGRQTLWKRLRKNVLSCLEKLCCCCRQQQQQ